MRIGIVLLALSALHTAAGAGAASRDSNDPVLRVRPVLCIADKDSGSCATVFEIEWRSPQPGNYCLASEQQSVPLRCWSQAAGGEHRDRVVVTRDFHYWLSQPDDPRRLSTVRVELLRLHADDRRRERRSRHVWDIL